MFASKSTIEVVKRVSWIAEIVQRAVAEARGGIMGNTMQTLNKPSQQKHVMRPIGRIFRSLNLFLILSLLLPTSGVQAQSPVTDHPTSAGSDWTGNGEPAFAQGSTTMTVDTVTNDDIPPAPYTMIDLGTLSGGSSYAVAINEAGQVIGISGIASGCCYHAFVWDGGVMTDLGTFGGY